HKVYLRISHSLKDLCEHGVLGEVTMNKGHIRDTVHFQDVGSDQAALPTNQTTGHLGPPTRGCAKINNAHAWTNQLVLVLDLQQLVAGPGTVAGLLRLFDVRIVEMLLQPLKASFGTGHGP